MEKALPAIPAKRYFTIGEVSELCGVKPYVLRYWEQEFTQLKPVKRRGNRRYYQHHEVLLIRRIRDLLYEQGFTISGARNRLTEAAHGRGQPTSAADDDDAELAGFDLDAAAGEVQQTAVAETPDIPQPEVSTIALSMPQMRQELISIRGLLAV
ncbi:MAG: MerR family transcriptional regulator [Burkholderiales bacterium]|nr:MerR family transcriptional regulator [Burkholderiales bacterium]MDE2300369.1 MerR family transcriptional regulator [Burkholderiales bacterium]MDE2626261.1 MerR family transcriptional regulator [Burkholderiales bacterium]